MKIKGLIILAALMALAIPAQAATYTACSASVADDVSPNLDCEISSETQDNTNPPLVVNESGGFFDIADWIYADKNDNPGQLSGSWDFSTAVAAISDPIDNLMVVFKDGAGTSLVGYLLAATTTSITYTSPFHAPDFNVGDTTKAVSHISLYYTEGTTSLSEPATMLLFGAGLLGVAATRRRRKAAVS